MTKLRLQNILREIPFWAIGLLMVIFCVINGAFAGEVSGVKVWPVTYLMLELFYREVPISFSISLPRFTPRTNLA